LASLFVYPSFFEGFGFPPLEAMGCGIPTITANTSSFPEVAGSAALMVDPYNFGEIAWAMREILNDKNLADEMIKKGLEQAKKFSWDRCAKETLEFLIS
jgi:glycosyltransferase involved in cell wall biosynthesis